MPKSADIYMDDNDDGEEEELDYDTESQIPEPGKNQSLKKKACQIRRELENRLEDIRLKRQLDDFDGF